MWYVWLTFAGKNRRCGKIMENNPGIIEKRTVESGLEPFVFRRSCFDRRSGIDRRSAHGLQFWTKCLVERRMRKERRISAAERRTTWVRVTRWSSVHGVLNCRKWAGVFSFIRKV
jgi:hypothetical protein